MVRRGTLAIVVGLGVCAIILQARADQVILPLAGSSWSTTALGDPFGGGPFLAVAQLPHAAAPGDQRYWNYVASLQFSLASLPANAVVTSASLTYEGDLLGAVTHSTGACTVQISLGEPFPTLEATMNIDASGVHTANLSDLSLFSDRAAHFPSGIATFDFTSATYNGEVDIIYQQLPEPVVHTLPTLTLNFTVAPEPASVGVLGVGMLLLLRRRR